MREYQAGIIPLNNAPVSNTIAAKIGIETGSTADNFPYDYICATARFLGSLHMESLGGLRAAQIAGIARSLELQKNQT